MEKVEFSYRSYAPQTNLKRVECVIILKAHKRFFEKVLFMSIIFVENANNLSFHDKIESKIANRAQNRHSKLLINRLFKNLNY